MSVAAGPAGSRGAAHRLGVDVGGTFTDVALAGPDGTITTRKVLSSTDDYARGVLAGVQELLRAADVPPDRVAEVLHGTTIATNAVLERRGAVTGLLTTEGFRDVLEIGRLRLARLYDLSFERPPPLVPRRLRRTVDERVDFRGRVVRPLDLDAAAVEVDRLVGLGVEAVAVCLLHAYANPQHEEALGALLRERAPHVAVTLSSDLLPEVREFERTSTTVANAYVMPAMRRYLDQLQAGLAALGVSADVLVMQSNGGVMTAREAARHPVHIIESGPAAGVVAAAQVARRLDRPNVISVDMGGTTAKAAVIEDSVVTRTGEFEIGGTLSQGSRLNRGSGFLLRVPAIDIAEIGAGGGSIVHVDGAGQLLVGPRSAGAVPGPACYDQGGEDATLTDANVVLGYLDAERLPSGLRLDGALAARAVTEHAATPLDLPLLDAALGVYRLGAARMARAVRAVTVERGRSPGDFALVAFGGNGPLFAAEIAQSLGIPTVLVPPSPGVLSAVGLLGARLEHHLVRTLLVPLSDDATPHMAAALDELEATARKVLADADPDAPVDVVRSADLRYQGQSYELTIAVPDDLGAGGSAAAMARAFSVEHERTYGHASPGDAVHVVNVRLTGAAVREHPAPVHPRDARRPLGASRSAYFGGALGRLETPVVGRDDLDVAPRPGPLLVDEYDATTRVPPGVTARLDAGRTILLEVGRP